MSKLRAALSLAMARKKESMYKLSSSHAFLLGGYTMDLQVSIYDKDFVTQHSIESVYMCMWTELMT